MSAFPERNVGDYKRISVLGISGSGKSTFSRVLSEKTMLPAYHMDSLFWGPDWQERPESYWVKKEAEIYNKAEWILEGYIDANHCERLKHSDLVIYLDISGWACALNGLKRWWQYKGSSRPEIQGCKEKLDPKFLWTMLMRKERPDIESALSEVNVRKLLRLKTVRTVKNFLKEI